jgi:hypothetical protein
MGRVKAEPIKNVFYRGVQKGVFIEAFKALQKLSKKNSTPRKDKIFFAQRKDDLVVFASGERLDACIQFSTGGGEAHCEVDVKAAGIHQLLKKRAEEKAGKVDVEVLSDKLNVGGISLDASIDSNNFWEDYLGPVHVDLSGKEGVLLMSISFSAFKDIAGFALPLLPPDVLRGIDEHVLVTKEGDQESAKMTDGHRMYHLVYDHSLYPGPTTKEVFLPRSVLEFIAPLLESTPGKTVILAMEPTKEKKQVIYKNIFVRASIAPGVTAFLKYTNSTEAYVYEKTGGLNYPDIKNLNPRPTAVSFDVNHAAMKSACEDIVDLCMMKKKSDDDKRVEVQSDGEEVFVSSTKLGKRWLIGKNYNGDETKLNISFNPFYLIDAVEIFERKEEAVQAKIDIPGRGDEWFSPLFFTGSSGRQSIVMPMRC